MDNGVKYSNYYYVTSNEEEITICFKHCHRKIEGDTSGKEFSDLPLQYDDIATVVMHPNKAKELVQLLERLMNP